MNVTVETVTSRKLAAVRRQVALSAIAQTFRPALDQVWTFLRAHPGLHAGGHNVFVYHHPAQRELPMRVDFGVEVLRSFDAEGEVMPRETPAGNVATALHVGSYGQLRQTHDAIHAWSAQQGRRFAGVSWEIYGDWSDDVSKLETTVCYLLD